AEGEAAAFEIITVSRDGKPVAASNLSWELYREDYYYQWYQRSGRWRYEWVLRDSAGQSGHLSTDGKGPALLSQQLTGWGRYRLEVLDPATGAATSVRFSSGWAISPQAADSPDKVPVEARAEKPVYQAGEVAHVAIKSSFAGEALVTVMTDRLHRSELISVPKDGAQVAIPTEPEWGPGAYALVSVYRPLGSKSTVPLP